MPGTGFDSTATSVSQKLRTLGTKRRAQASIWFFKTGKGQYGEGDKFIGITVPAQRKVAKSFSDLPLSEIRKLLKGSWHEERLTALFILCAQYKKGSPAQRQKIEAFYIRHMDRVNNWDLVDSSAHIIFGPALGRRSALHKRLIRSPRLWYRRIAMIATAYEINQGRFDRALSTAKALLGDKEDLMHKAVGWMLREVGKRDEAKLRRFLNTHGPNMPRTALRYAIEKFSKAERKKLLKRYK